MRRTVLALIALVGVVSCSSTHHGMTRAKARAVTARAVADAAAILGPSWKVGPPPGPRADATIADHCGDPLVGLGAPRDDLLGDATSPVLSSDQRLVAGPNGHGSVRTAVLAYRDDASGKAAFGKLTVRAFEDCLVGAVSTYLDGDHPDAERVTDPTVDAFDTTTAPVSAGDEATLIASTFEEEVLGGFDNSHNLALFAARSGAVVVTALAASASQSQDPRNPAALARRLGTSALARANE